MLSKTKLLEVLNKNVDPTLYLITLSIVNKDKELFNLFWNMLGVGFGKDLQNLKEMKFLEFENKDVFKEHEIIFEKLKVSDYFLNLFSIPGTGKRDLYDELIKAYPVKTPNGRRLRVYSTTLPKKYLKLINNDVNEHELVLLCLKAEIEERTKNGNLNFMYMLSTYINNAYWRIYLDDVKERKEREDRGEQPEEEQSRFKIF
jgi:hypothetical protein